MTAKSFAQWFVAGTVLTFGVAGVLWAAKQRALAAGVILVSPFPCPPGAPC